jgi:hypothetical protein
MNYLHAVASIYFLLDHQAGREWLKCSFSLYSQNPCRRINAEQLFSQNYSNGIEGASCQLKMWLDRGEFASHHY